METENSQKELDLIDLIKICWGWFISYIFKPVVFLLRYIIKKWWVILISAIIGFAISYCISTFCPKYVASVVYQNNVGSSSDYINSIRPLARTTPEYISSVLDIPIDEADNIIAIAPHALYFNDTLHTSFYVDMYDMAGRESSALQNRFAIEILAYDLKSFEHLQDGFVKYFSNNSFFSKQAESRIKTLDSSSKLAKDEADKLDGLRVKGSSNNGLVLSGGDVYPVMDPASISREVLRLNEISVNHNNALEYGSGVVSVVSPLMIEKIPVNFYMRTYKKWVTLCVLLGLALSFCISYRKEILALIKV